MLVMLFLKLSFLIILSLCSTLVFGKTDPVVIKVGGYEYPPFVENEGKEGIVKDLIYKLNTSQKKYYFEFVLTSPKRRYRDFKFQKFDVILFEDEAWEWKKSGILYDKTVVLGNGTELIVALNDGIRNQKYFDSLNYKKVGKV